MTEPLYLRVERDLAARIASGELKAGEYLPSEAALQGRYRVSRTTIRTALANLVASGQVRIDRGVGTLILDTTAGARQPGLISFSQTMRELGREPGLGTSSVRLSADGSKVVVRRVHTADGEAISISESWLPAELFSGVPLDALTEQTSLYERLNQLAAGVQEVVDSYGIALANAEIATDLQVAEGSPLLLIERISHSSDGQLVETSRIVANPDRYRPVIITRRSR